MPRTKKKNGRHRKISKRKSSQDATVYTHEMQKLIDIKRRENLIETVHEYNINPVVGEIFLMGEELDNEEDPGQEPGVEYQMANRFIRNISLLQRDKSVQAILIYMKTCGGMWEEGMAIHNAIKACPTPVTILNYTHARSMSSIIMQAANKRVMMPDSYFMYHTGDLTVSGISQSVYSEVDFARKYADPRMLEIYATEMQKQGVLKDESKKSIKEQLVKQMQQKVDVFLTAKESVKWGLADEVFGGNGTYNWDKLTEYTEEQLER